MIFFSERITLLILGIELSVRRALFEDTVAVTEVRKGAVLRYLGKAFKVAPFSCAHQIASEGKQELLCKKDSLISKQTP